MRRRKIFTDEFWLSIEKGLHAGLLLLLAVIVVAQVVMR